jgi:hypothetical protein
MLRLILYILAGITTALLGWNLSQATFGLLGFLENIPILSTVSQLRQWEDIIVFPFITVCLSAGMVLNEIFITNPTRPKLNWRIAQKPMIYTVLCGLLAGLAIGGLLQIFYQPQFQIEERTVRVISWWCIGAVVGLIEGLTWVFYNMEAGDEERRRKRQFISLFAASFASIVAAGLFEIIRNHFNTTSDSFQQIEDPIGFCILGALLGITFTFTTSPSYMVALRAGKGFEYRGEDISRVTVAIDPNYAAKQASLEPVISSEAIETLKFVTDSSKKKEQKIEEGLSVRLPDVGKIAIGGRMPKKTMSNGQKVGSDIYLPHTLPFLAHIEMGNRQAKLIPNPNLKQDDYKKIEINGIPLDTSEEIVLKHNTLIAFYTDKPDDDNPNLPKMYRFVYYNRFLDPEG